MTNQKLSLLNEAQKIETSRNPSKRYLIKRIDEDSIEISEQQRDYILGALQGGVRFVQIGDHTLMLNAIKSIDPKKGKQYPQLSEEALKILNTP